MKIEQELKDPRFCDSCMLMEGVKGGWFCVLGHWLTPEIVFVNRKTEVIVEVPPTGVSWKERDHSLWYEVTLRPKICAVKHGL